MPSSIPDHANVWMYTAGPTPGDQHPGYYKEVTEYLLPSGRVALVSVRSPASSDTNTAKVSQSSHSRRSYRPDIVARIRVTPDTRWQRMSRGRKACSDLGADLSGHANNVAKTTRKPKDNSAWLERQHYTFTWDDTQKDWKKWHGRHSRLRGAAGRHDSLSSVGEILELPKAARAARKE